VLAWPEAVERTVRRVVPFTRLADRLVAILEGIRLGFEALRSPTRLGGVILWSLAVWLVNGLSFLVLFPAFGIPADPAMALLLQGVIVFGIAVPSSPGYIGVFEAAIVLALGLHGIPQDRAFAYAATYHVTTFIPITLLGAGSVIQSGLGWRAMRTGPDD
jgi:hypothetical protein